MMIGLIVVVVVVVLLVVIAIALIGIYNSLVQLRIRADNAWADIDVQLKRRYDLIPNLVETVKGYAAHEKGTFENVAKFRSAATGIYSTRQHGAVPFEFKGDIGLAFRTRAPFSFPSSGERIGLR